jgi:hypothetical protein
MPWCDTQAMTEHLKEISATVDKGAHAVLMLDQAGWHGSAGLIVPANITLLPLLNLPWESGERFRFYAARPSN